MGQTIDGEIISRRSPSRAEIRNAAFEEAAKAGERGKKEWRQAETEYEHGYEQGQKDKSQAILELRDKTND